MRFSLGRSYAPDIRLSCKSWRRLGKPESEGAVEQMDGLKNRRPLAIRQREWVHKLARLLVRQGVSPNQVSLASVGFAALGALAYGFCPLAGDAVKAFLLLSAAVFIQLRLLSNLLDGIMAVEEGKKTPAGEIYNELPDRIADCLFFVAAGYAAGWPVLGWVSAILALMTAYVRALGGALGFAQDFCGPMAKQHRMHALCAGSVLAAFFSSVPVLAATLALIILGSLLTVARRTLHLARALARKAQP